jgi:hypothetical protein
MEEAEHRHLRDELLDAAAEPIKDMVCWPQRSCKYACQERVQHKA